MRRLILALLISPFLLTSCNTVLDKDTAKATLFTIQLAHYINPVTEKYNALVGKTQTLLEKAVQNNLSPEDIRRMRSETEALKELISTTMDSVKMLEEPDEEIRLKEASINYLTVCKTSLDKEYQEFMENVQKEMTRENLLTCGRLMISIWEKLVDIEKETMAIRKKFGDKYKLDLTKNSQDYDRIEREIENYKKRLGISDTGK